ncbi:MAG TPA: ACT domain-containing protein, partial [Candidatus Dormibacteraeota bacterium]|nr:ACT domain-containing protein [Candidatus Dormibacteraeota bacterium]
MTQPTPVHDNAEILALLVSFRDEPGVLFRVTEVIFRAGGNVKYVATTGVGEATAEIQFEVAGIDDSARLMAALTRLEHVLSVAVVP